MLCNICGTGFTPSKFNPHQKFCSPECRAAGRRAYKADYDRRWRDANPDYMRQYLYNYRTLERVISSVKNTMGGGVHD